MNSDEWETTYKQGFRNGLEVARRTQDRRWWLALVALVIVLVVVLAGVLAAPADAKPAGCLTWYLGHWVCR
jgi:hypothetical protein